MAIILVFELLPLSRDAAGKIQSPSTPALRFSDALNAATLRAAIGALMPVFGGRFFQSYSWDSRKAKDTALREQPDRGKIGFDMTLSIWGAPDVALWQEPKDGRFE
jgi:hypothetical protein